MTYEPWFDQKLRDCRISSFQEVSHKVLDPKISVFRDGQINLGQNRCFTGRTRICPLPLRLYQKNQINIMKKGLHKSENP